MFSYAMEVGICHSHIQERQKTDIENYRPITILSNFSKSFESLIYKTISAYIFVRLSPLQHGFVRGRSTATNLMCLTQSIAETLDNSGQVDVIYTDFSKAFDSINHELLLHKLNLSPYLNYFVTTWIIGYCPSNSTAIFLTHIFNARVYHKAQTWVLYYSWYSSMIFVMYLRQML